MEDATIPAQAPNGADPEPASPDTNDQVSALLAQLEQTSNDYDKLAAEASSLRELAQRRQADFDNYRRRAEREKQEMADYAAHDTCLALVPILDDFERALKAAGDTEQVREYAKGVEMIHQRLRDTLVKVGVSVIEAAGKPFDPNLHFAVQREERDDVDGDTVIEEYQRGYMFKSRLLRAAMVKVAVRP
jgi:molecular chaperone GrpE